MNKPNQDFHEIFTTHIFPNILKLDSDRRRIVRKAKKHKLILLPFVVFGSIYMATEIIPWCESIIEFYILFSVIVSVCFILYFTINPLHLVFKKQINSIKYKYKKVLINSILDHFCEELKYHPIIKTNKNQFNRSEIFKNKITEVKEDDGILGSINTMNLKISDVLLRSDLKKLFHGLFLVIDTPMLFNKNVLLKSKNGCPKTKFLQKVITIYNEQILSLNNKTLLKEFELEEVALIKELNVFIESIAAISKNTFYASITKKKIYCAIAVNKNLFEINLRKSFDIQKDYILSETYLLFCIFQGLKVLQKNIYTEILQKS